MYCVVQNHFDLKFILTYNIYTDRTTYIMRILTIKKMMSNFTILVCSQFDIFLAQFTCWINIQQTFKNPTQFLFTSIFILKKIIQVPMKTKHNENNSYMDSCDVILPILLTTTCNTLDSAMIQPTILVPLMNQKSSHFLIISNKLLLFLLISNYYFIFKA